MNFALRFFRKKDFNSIYNNETVTDIDGNVYHTVKIGKQIWTVENLKVTKYRNGDAIPFIVDDSKWLKQGYNESDAYCYYLDEIANFHTYGCLYNWFVVIDKRGLCPEGWHVPNNEEWQTLINYLGGEESNAGNKMKEPGTTHWKTPNEGASNKSGFSALPGGYRLYNGNAFCGIKRIGYWWSVTEYDAGGAWSCELEFDNPGVHLGRGYGSKTSGFSIRCLKDL